MAPIQSSPNTQITLSSTSEYPQYVKHETCKTFLNCRLTGPQCQDNQRKPVDIVVVLDRSGSMSGSKLTLCKNTVEFLIRELSSSDRLSLITYDTNVTTNVPLTLMTAKGKARVTTALGQIHAGASTNLSGGLLAGMQEIQATTRVDGGSPNAVKSVLLLTDGMANVGLTKTPEIMKMLEGSLATDVTLFTFGYGSNHNVDMLRQISDMGRGMYYFVQSIDGVSLAFADCLGGLLSVVAQNITLECSAVGDASILSIKTKKPVSTILKNKIFSVDLGDLYAEEERDILLEITLPPVPAEEMDIAVVEFTLKYANVLASCLDETKTTVTVDRVDEIVKKIAVDTWIQEQKSRIAAVEAIENAKASADTGNLAEGRSIIDKTLLQLREMEVECPGAQGLIADLEECQTNMSTTAEYASRGQHRMCSKVQSHWNQRSNDIEMDAECTGAPAMASKYRSKKKGSMLHRAMNMSKR